MSATVRTPIQISRSGVADNLAAINDVDGETWANTGIEYLEIVNSGSTALTASIPYANTVDGQTVPPKTNSIAASAREKWGPFPVPLFGAAPIVTWSGDTSSATVQVVRTGS